MIERTREPWEPEELDLRPAGDGIGVIHGHLYYHAPRFAAYDAKRVADDAAARLAALMREGR